MTKLVKLVTGKRINCCLMTMHILNFLLLFACTIFYAVQPYERSDTEQYSNENYDGHPQWVLFIVMICVDVSLLFLLFKILKRRRMTRDRQEASTLLYPHDYYLERKNIDTSDIDNPGQITGEVR